MKVFHLNDSNFIVERIGKYHSTNKEYWGHIITNRANRVELKYAWIFDPKGERANLITKETFKMLTTRCEHIYINSVNEFKLNRFINQIPSLSKFQTHRLFKCLVDNSEYISRDRDTSGERYSIILKD